MSRGEELRLSIIGLGRLGLPIALLYASKGHNVIGVDSDEDKIISLIQGQSPLDETGVQLLLDEAKSIEFTTDMNKIRDTEAIFIVVGTPCNEDGSVDLSQIEQACKSIGRALEGSRDSQLIVNKSTVPPGTLRQFIKPIIVENSKVEQNIHVYAYSPEYIALGSVLRDLEYPRPGYAAIGELSRSAGERLTQFLGTIYRKGSVKYLRTTPENMEVIKYASNTYFTTKIAFINLIADVCQHIPHTDAKVVSYALGLDPRISPKQFEPGLPFGGPCFPKDLKQFTAYLDNTLHLPHLLSYVLDENQWHHHRIMDFISSKIGNAYGQNIVILGSSYKPDTNLEIESPGKFIGEQLEQLGANVNYFNPPGDPPLDNADAVIVCAPWREFYKITANDFRRRMARPLVIDLTRVYEPTLAEKIEYHALGLGEEAKE